MANTHDFGDRGDRRMDDKYASLSQQSRQRSRSPPPSRGAFDADNRRPIVNISHGDRGVDSGRGGGGGFTETAPPRRGRGGYQGPRIPAQGFTNRFQDSQLDGERGGFEGGYGGMSGGGGGGGGGMGMSGGGMGGGMGGSGYGGDMMGGGGGGGQPNVRFGDWHCVDCDCSNFRNREACYKCHKTKPEDAPSSVSVMGAQGRMGPNTDLMGMQRPVIEVRPGDWECVDCKVSVFASKTACFKCNKPKPENPILSTSLCNWECTDCFAMNHSKRYDCFKCQRAKPVNAKTAEQLEDWACPGCSAMNASRRTNCMRCDAARPGRERELEANPDWKCSGCSIMNWSWRASCYKCNTGKSDSNTNENEAVARDNN